MYRQDNEIVIPYLIRDLAVKSFPYIHTSIRQKLSEQFLNG